MAVLKSAGLESLLKSKNSIGDLNPFNRVSYEKKRPIVSPIAVRKSGHVMS
jgi:hypothetical protein